MDEASRIGNVTERGNGDKENQAEKKNIKFHQFANRRLPIQFLSLLVASEGTARGAMAPSKYV